MLLHATVALHVTNYIIDTGLALAEVIFGAVNPSGEIYHCFLHLYSILYTHFVKENFPYHSPVMWERRQCSITISKEAGPLIPALCLMMVH